MLNHTIRHETISQQILAADKIYNQSSPSANRKYYKM